MKNTLLTLFLITLLAFTPGCAHMRDGSQTEHSIQIYGVVVPPGWTVVKPMIGTVTGNTNVVSDFAVIAPAGTNAPGFWSGLNRPRRFLAYRERWKDWSSGGGTFVLTDPQASQLVFNKINQSGLGGSRSVTVGNIQSTITTNAVAAITSGGSAIGNVIGAAASAAAK